MMATVPLQSRVLPVVVLFFLAVFFVAAIYPLRPPPAQGENCPPYEFSAARAMAHVRIIAQRPHPTGSQDNDRVREYIVAQMSALGLAPQVQSTVQLGSNPAFVNGAEVSNVVGRLPGRRHSKALLLAAHYDSVPGGPGAGDDASGIATILETARALRAGAPLENDVIFLATDGEELGLLGAQAFMTEHPFAKDVALVLNFEARGAGGPSMLFETGTGNESLVRQFAAVAPNVVGSSFLYEFYKRLPNNTDFTVFRRGGLTGYNFAYGGSWVRYHTLKDDAFHLDPRSLQQHGGYALALARHFGNAELPPSGGADAVYFGLLGRILVYPQSWALYLWAAAACLFVCTLVAGLVRKRITWSGLVIANCAWLGGAASVASLTALAWRSLAGSPLVSRLPYGSAYNGGLFAGFFVACTVSVMAAIYAVLRDRLSAENLAVGALLWWLVATTATGLFLRGASHIFVWPLAASLLTLCYSLMRRGLGSEWRRAWAWMPAALTAILFFAPPFHDLIAYMGSAALVPTVIATALLTGILYPQLRLMTARNKWWPAGASLVLALALFAGAALGRGYDADHPATDTLLYWYDADSRTAEWVAPGGVPDEWTAQFLGPNASKAVEREIGPFKIDVLKAPAPVVDLEAPRAAVLDAGAEKGIRRLKVQIMAPPQARVLWIEVRGPAVREAAIGGKKAGTLPREGPLKMYFAGVPAGGLTLDLTCVGPENPDLRVVAQCDGLPKIPGASYKPRPAHLMPSPSMPFDSTTMISRSFHNLVGSATRPSPAAPKIPAAAPQGRNEGKRVPLQ